jgi:hypothetical protein
MINALVSQGLSALPYEKVQVGGKLIDGAKSGSRTTAGEPLKGDAHAARSRRPAGPASSSARRQDGGYALSVLLGSLADR